MKKEIASSVFNKTENSKFDRIFFVLLFMISLSSLVSVNLVSAGEKYELKVTLEHPFLINDEWVPASQLQVGDLMTTVDGKKARITKITDVKLDEPVSVYNLEAGEFHNFVLSSGVVVHNSDLENRVFSYNWGKASKNLLPGSSREGMLEKIVLDSADPEIAGKVTRAYQETFGSITERPSILDLERAAEEFSRRMRQELPFLGYDNMWEFSTSSLNHKPAYYQYLTLSECSEAPKLSYLGKSKQLDCTGQVLTIREALGGEQSGWKVYHGIDSKGRTRPHTFLAKEFESYGKKFMVIIDPAEASLYDQSLIIECTKPHKLVVETERFFYKIPRTGARVDYPLGSINVPKRDITVYHGSSGSRQITENLQMYGPDPSKNFFLTPDISVARTAAGPNGKVLTYKIPISESNVILGEVMPYSGPMTEGPSIQYIVLGRDRGQALHKYLIEKINLY